MNRREAIAALISLPEIASISTVPAKSDDVIVIECDLYLTPEHVAQIRSTLKLVWPGRRCVVLEKGMTLKVVAQ